MSFDHLLPVQIVSAVLAAQCSDSACAASSGPTALPSPRRRIIFRNPQVEACFSRLFSMLPLQPTAPGPCSLCIGSAVCCVGRCWFPSTLCRRGAVCCVGRCSFQRAHSTQLERCLLCWQMPVPQHSLQLERCLPCWQTLVPAHSTQLERCLSCWQMPLPPHSLQ
jgi:hypothetical protein